MSDTVLYEVDNRVGVISLNRPDRRNSFSPEMMVRLGEVLAEVRANSDIRCVVIRANGKSFCSGADFTALSSMSDGAGGQVGIHKGIEAIYESGLEIGRLAVPTIAAVHGAAVGGGLGIALHCDIRIAADEAKIGANFSRLGIHSGMAISDVLPALVGYQRACDLLFTGRLVRGPEAAAIGLVMESVPRDACLPRAMELAHQIAASAPLAVQAMKRTLRMREMQWREPVLRAEAFSQSMLMATEDAQEGIRAVFGKREPDFKGK